jgi:hypothetical protein
VFSQYDGESVHIELKGFEVSANINIWIYTDANGLNKFFQELSCFQKPWQDRRVWTSIEGDFVFSATCSSLGSITFYVELRGLQGAPEEWRIEAGVVAEFGQLVQIAENAAVFFNAQPEL